MSEKKLLMPYLFNGKSIRVFSYNGEVWFVANDVGKALGMHNIRVLMNRVLVSGEYIYVKKLYDQKKRFWEITVTNCYGFNGGRNILAAINESGLYTLIMRSSKPEALKFRQWVTSEVLPSLRKTGSYEIPQTNVENETPQLSSGVNISITITGRLEEISEVFKKFPANNFAAELLK